jgi:hypothetical protein
MYFINNKKNHRLKFQFYNILFTQILKESCLYLSLIFNFK